MGISTVTAGRIRKGQLKGNNGEEEVTSMESLPHLALSKVNKCLPYYTYRRARLNPKT